MSEITPVILIQSPQILPSKSHLHKLTEKIALNVSLYGSALLASFLLIAGGITLLLGFSVGAYLLVGSGLCMSLFAIGTMLKSMHYHLKVSKNTYPIVNWKLKDTRKKNISEIISELNHQCSISLEKISSEKLLLQLLTLKDSLKDNLEKAQKIKSHLETELKEVETKHDLLLSLKRLSLSISDKEALETTLQTQQTTLQLLQQTLATTEDTENQAQLKLDIQTLQQNIRNLYTKINLIPLVRQDGSYSLLNKLLLAKIPDTWNPLPKATSLQFLDILILAAETRKERLNNSLKQVSFFVESTQQNYDWTQTNLSKLEQTKVNLLESLRVLKELETRNYHTEKSEIRTIKNNIFELLAAAETTYSSFQRDLIQEKPLKNLYTSLKEIWKEGQQLDILSPLVNLFLPNPPATKDKLLLNHHAKTIKPSYQISIPNLNVTSCLSIKQSQIIQTALYVSVCAGVALTIAGTVLVGLGLGAGIGVISGATLFTGAIGIALILTQLKKPLSLPPIKKSPLYFLKKAVSELESRINNKGVIEKNTLAVLSEHHLRQKGYLNKAEEFHSKLEKVLTDQEKRLSQLQNMELLESQLQNEILEEEKKIVFVEKVNRLNTTLGKNTVSAYQESIDAKNSLLKILHSENPTLLALLDVAITSSKDLSTTGSSLEEKQKLTSCINKLKNVLLATKCWIEVHKAYFEEIEELFLELQQNNLDLLQAQHVIKILQNKLFSSRNNIEEIATTTRIVTSLEQQINTFDRLILKIQSHIRDYKDRKESFHNLKEFVKNSFDDADLDLPALEFLREKAKKSLSTKSVDLDLPTPTPSITSTIFDPNSPKIQKAAQALLQGLKQKTPDLISTAQRFINIIVERKFASIIPLLGSALAVPSGYSKIWGPFVRALELAQNHDHLDLLYVLLTNTEVRSALYKFILEWHKIHVESKKSSTQPARENKSETSQKDPPEKLDIVEVTEIIVFLFHHIMTFILPSIFIHNTYSEKSLSTFKKAIGLSDEEFNKTCEEGSWWLLIMKGFFEQDPALKAALINTTKTNHTSIQTCKQIGIHSKHHYEKRIKERSLEIEITKQKLTDLLNTWAKDYPELDINNQPPPNMAMRLVNFTPEELQNNSLKTKIFLEKQLETLEKQNQEEALLSLHTIQKIVSLRIDHKEFDHLWNSVPVKLALTVTPSFVFRYHPAIESLFSVGWIYIISDLEKENLSKETGLRLEDLENAAKNAQLLELVLPYVKEILKKKARN